MNEGIEYGVLTRLTQALHERLDNEVNHRVVKLNELINDTRSRKADIGNVAVEIWELKKARAAARFLMQNDQQAVTKHTQLVSEACKNIIDLVFSPTRDLDYAKIRSVFHFIKDEDTKHLEEETEDVVLEEEREAQPVVADAPIDPSVPDACRKYIMERCRNDTDNAERFQKYIERMIPLVHDELSSQYGPDYPLWTDSEISVPIDMRCRELLTRTYDLLHSDATEEED